MKEGARDVSSLVSADMVCLLRPTGAGCERVIDPWPRPPLPVFFGPIHWNWRTGVLVWCCFGGGRLTCTHTPHPPYGDHLLYVLCTLQPTTAPGTEDVLLGRRKDAKAGNVSCLLEDQSGLGGVCV